MQDADALLKTWLETVGEYAIFLLDTAGNVASWNAGAERIFGYRAEEIVGQPAALVFTPEDRQSRFPEQEMGTALANGTSLDDRWHLRKDGSRFWASGVLTLLRAGDGTPRAFVKAVRDQTGLKDAADQEHRRAGELLEADRRKNEFLAMLSHELRTPLAPILNSVFVLCEQFPSEDPVVVQSRSTIERQVMNLKRMVDDLLDVSRIATHKLQLQKQRTVLGDAVDHAVEVVRELMTERRHELIVALHAARGAVLDADPIRLEQALANLLTNAAKYTEPGGSIWLTGALEPAAVELRVRDTGIGIAPELLPRIFDLYIQADTSLARTQGGLGIGLTLVRSLVELHGGTIRAHSEGLGRGSEFTIRLPLPPREAQGPARPAVAPARRAVRPLRVLVVEDNVDTARTLGLLLRRVGHEVHAAHDGPTALTFVREQPLDVVLLDIGLPGMDGYEVARQIKAEWSLPLIAMTGYAKEGAAASDFDHYLVKPVSPDELLNLLGRIDRT